VTFGNPGHPPVEAGIVDQHDGIRSATAEFAAGRQQQPDGQRDLGQGPEDTHDRVQRQIFQQMTTGGRHLGPAEADKLGPVALRPELANQVGSVQIAARFSHGEENAHRTTDVLIGLLQTKTPSVQYRKLEKWTDDEIRDVLADLDLIELMEELDKEKE